MSIAIGIRHEDKYELEVRVPLTPKHVETLIKKHKLDVIVQSSSKRIFKDEEYIKVGAKVQKDLKKASVIFGVKEIPIEVFEPEKTYVFFAHVIKGQKHNMPMLKRMMELKCTLIDYERIVDEQNKRLVFFGKYAGYAGMINTLWSLGLRLNYFGIKTPFLKIKQAHKYYSLEEAKKAISEVGQEIAENGLPQELLPLTFGITGYGNVSQGVQEILGLLPVKEISPEKLLTLSQRNKLPNNIVYKIIFKEEHIYQPIDSKVQFDLEDCWKHPENYKSVFEQYLPHLTTLVNCIFWTDKYPRIFTKDYCKKLYTQGEPKIKVIGDISCDINGSIEFTHKGTPINDPIFVYNPFTGEPTSGYTGDGILVMAVDILPAELPRDSSIAFGDALINFVKPIAYADYDKSFEDLDLPKAIKKAVILLKGKLTPEYKYIEQFL